MTIAVSPSPSFTRDEVLGITLLPPVTDRQLEVLQTIYTVVQTEKRYPTQRQVAELLGYTQTAATGHINALVKKGYLAREAGTTRRNIRLTSLAIEKLEGDKQLALNLKG